MRCMQARTRDVRTQNSSVPATTSTNDTICLRLQVGGGPVSTTARSVGVRVVIDDERRMLASQGSLG